MGKEISLRANWAKTRLLFSVLLLLVFANICNATITHLVSAQIGYAKYNDFNKPVNICTTSLMDVNTVAVCNPTCKDGINVKYQFYCKSKLVLEREFKVSDSGQSESELFFSMNSYPVECALPSDLRMRVVSTNILDPNEKTESDWPINGLQCANPNTAPDIKITSPDTYRPGMDETLRVDAIARDSQDMASRLDVVLDIMENGTPKAKISCLKEKSCTTMFGKDYIVDNNVGISFAQNILNLNFLLDLKKFSKDILVHATVTDPGGLFGGADKKIISTTALKAPQIQGHAPTNPKNTDNIKIVALQPDGVKGADWHIYRVYDNGNKLIYESDKRLLKSDGSSDFSFTCEKSKCTSEIYVQAYAQKGNDKSADSTPAYEIKIITQKPEPPKIVSHYPNVVKNDDEIEVFAEQEDKADGVQTHRYQIYFDGGMQTLEEVPLTDGKSSYKFTCTANKCKEKVVVYAYAIKEKEVSDVSNQYVIIIGTGVLNPPSDVKLVLSGTTIYATATQTDDEATGHRYVWYYVDKNGDTQTWDEEKIIIDNRKSQTATRTINPLDGWQVVAINVYSTRGQDESTKYATATQKLDYKLAKLQVESASPDPDGKILLYLSSGNSAKIAKDAGIDVKMKTTGTGWQAPDEYRFDTYVNGVFKETKTDKNGNHLVSCVDLKCADGDKIVVKVTGIKGVLKSDEYSLKFYVPSALQQPIGADDICTAGSERGVIENSMKYMAIGIAAILALVVIVYMIGNAIHHPQMLDWAKMEILQVLMSIAIFALILFLVNVECNMNILEPAGWFGFAGVQSASLLQYSQNYIQNIVEEAHLAVVSLRYEMGILNIRATFNNYESANLGIGGNGYSISPYSGDWTTMGTAQMLLGLNSSFMLNGIFHFFSLFFFATASGIFVLFLPIGFFLRSMPFMRGVGATLIAIVVGLYIFYPLVFAMIGLMVEQSGSTHYVLNTVPDKFGGSNVPERISAIEAQESSLATNGKDTYSGGQDSLPKPLLSSPGNDKMLDLPAYYKITAYNFIRIVLLPTVGMLIVIVFIRDLAALMGEEVDASKLLQMV
ncbi:MAG: hypothetical protein WC492_00910 [Candidatus Micrarchaeia archaeon]